MILIKTKCEKKSPKKSKIDPAGTIFSKITQICTKMLFFCLTDTVFSNVEKFYILMDI